MAMGVELGTCCHRGYHGRKAARKFGKFFKAFPLVTSFVQLMLCYFISGIVSQRVLHSSSFFSPFYDLSVVPLLEILHPIALKIACRERWPCGESGVRRKKSEPCRGGCG